MIMLVFANDVLNRALHYCPMTPSILEVGVLLGIPSHHDDIINNEISLRCGIFSIRGI